MVDYTASVNLNTKVLDFFQLGGPQSGQSRMKVGPGAGATTGDFGNHIAATVWEFVEQITPIVDALEDAGNQMDETLSPNVPPWSPSMRPPSVDFL